MKLITILTLLLILISCNDKNKARTSLSGGTEGCSAGSVASSSEGPLFKLDGKVYTRADLSSGLVEMVFQNEYEAYNKNQNIFKEFALRVYLAKKANKLTDVSNPPPLMELLDIPAPKDSEIKKLFEQSKGRLPKNVTFETMKPQIVNYLKSQKISQVFQTEVAKMEKDGVYQSMVAGPVAPEIELNTDKHPTTGNKDSKIKIVEIADYTCGHCQHAHPVVKEILKKYGSKISFTQINFSLRPEGKSGLFTKGAYCAQKQSTDIFWKYHDLAFAKTSEPHDHSAHGHSHGNTAENKAEILEVAKKAGVKTDEFSKCIDSAESKDFVMSTIKELSEKGISGTPVFIINKKKIMGGVNALESEIKSLL